MFKRQQQGASVSDPALVEATIQLLSASDPEQPASTWNLLRPPLSCLGCGSPGRDAPSQQPDPPMRVHAARVEKQERGQAS
jgi:hypothetical protein